MAGSRTSRTRIRVSVRSVLLPDDVLNTAVSTVVVERNLTKVCNVHGMCKFAVGMLRLAHGGI